MLVGTVYNRLVNKFRMTRQRYYRLVENFNYSLHLHSSLYLHHYHSHSHNQSNPQSLNLSYLCLRFHITLKYLCFLIYMVPFYNFIFTHVIFQSFCCCCCCRPHPSTEEWWRGPTTVSTHTGRWYAPSNRNPCPLVDWWSPSIQPAGAPPPRDPSTNP